MNLYRSDLKAFVYSVYIPDCCQLICTGLTHDACSIESVSHISYVYRCDCLCVMLVVLQRQLCGGDGDNYG